MRLSEEDSKLFYKCWLPLLDYVNEQKKVNRNLHNISKATALNPKEVKEVANVLWTNTDLIDSYIAAQDKISDDERDLVLSWKKCVNGLFILERILKKGAMLISMDNREVYQVSGIISSWDEMLGYVRLPMIIDVTIIPFRDVIISDGLVQRYNVSVGGNMAGTFRDVYMHARNAGLIHTRL